MSAQLEAELREHVAEQEEALAAVRGALEAGNDPDLAEVLEQLGEALRETEAALAELTGAERAAPLALEVDGRDAGGAPPLPVLDGSEARASGRMAAALAQAAGLVRQAVEAGPQAETKLFSGWESHTRGIGSKLLLGMGFRGGGLGREQQGTAVPLAGELRQKGAGLGMEPLPLPAQPSGTGAEIARKRTAAQQQDARRERQQELERKTGSEGLFAVINHLIGDQSEERATRREWSGQGRREAPAPGQAQPKARPTGPSGSGGGSDRGSGDRRSLAAQQDSVAAQRLRVAALAASAARNAGDKVMATQVQRALADARAKLVAAEASHRRATEAVAGRERREKWAKF